MVWWHVTHVTWIEIGIEIGICLLCTTCFGYVFQCLEAAVWLLMCFSASLLWAGVLQAEPHLIHMVTSCLHVYIVVGELREVLGSTWLSIALLNPLNLKPSV